MIPPRSNPKRPSMAVLVFGVLVLGAAAGPAAAQANSRPAAAAAQANTSQAAAPKDRSSAFGTMGSNREPIKIDADRLDVFDRESRAVFAGNVVAVQGDTTMRCKVLTVLYESKNGAAGGAKPQGTAASPSESAIKKIDCTGPVTIVSKTQVATGDNATFDRVANRVFLIGNATLSDGPNVTTGGRVVYDLNTGIANVENPTQGGRVRALFVPGSAPPAGAAARSAAPSPGAASTPAKTPAPR